MQFPDYTVEQLGEILDLMAEKSGFSFAEGAREKALGIIRDAAREEDFGNARFVRNLLEDAVIAQGARLSERLAAGEGAAALDDDALRTLLPEDFRTGTEDGVACGASGLQRRMGFCAPAA